jgi:hypothetical protein
MATIHMRVETKKKKRKRIKMSWYFFFFPFDLLISIPSISIGLERNFQNDERETLWEIFDLNYFTF